MKMKIVFATNNAHKLDELRRITGGKIEILGLKDIGCDVDIPETGDTLQENALQKARYVRDHYGMDCFADDTGLEVDALDGAPGVRSARYAPGDGHDSAANMALLLKNMDGVSDRKARFRTVIALIIDGKEHLFEGKVEGDILEAPAGTGGFGYDPVFRPRGWTRTFAEASQDEKNAVSHRGRAVRKLLDFFNENYI
ncbi:MAG: non-canonical purine NTP diphosphatase [Muribaculaceae bacterium]|nr:non-canonical purine NTP diphosphatase [Muribaculaceae bacterium]